MAENRDLAVSVYRAYLWTSGPKSTTDPGAFKDKKGKSVEPNEVRRAIEYCVNQKPYLAKDALDRIQIGLAMSGEKPVDMNSDLNPYSLTTAAKYIIWKELTKTNIYNEVGYIVDNPNPVSYIAEPLRAWNFLGDDYEFNPSLNIEYTPFGQVPGSLGWDGDVLHNVGVGSSFKFDGIGIAARPLHGTFWENIYLYGGIGIERTNFKNCSPESRDPLDLGYDSKFSWKGVAVMQNPLFYLLFGNRTEYSSFTLQYDTINDYRGDVVTPFSPGQQLTGYTFECFNVVGPGPGGAAGLGLGLRNYWGNRFEIPGDPFGYQISTAFFNVKYMGELEGLKLGLDIHSEAGNSREASAAGYMDWTGKNPGLTFPDLGSGSDAVNNEDWYTYNYQNRSVKLSLGIPSWKVDLLNAYPEGYFKLSTETRDGKEQSTIYTVGVKLGQIDVSGWEGMNVIPRDRASVGAAGLESRITYGWEAKVPLDALYWWSRSQGEIDPEVNGGALLTLGGYWDEKPYDGSTKTNSGFYFRTTLFFGSYGNQSKKDRRELDITQSPTVGLMKEVAPEVAPLMDKVAKEKDEKALEKAKTDKTGVRPDWRNPISGQEQETKEPEQPKEPEGTTEETK